MKIEIEAKTYHQTLRALLNVIENFSVFKDTIVDEGLNYKHIEKYFSVKFNIDAVTDKPLSEDETIM